MTNQEAYNHGYNGTLTLDELMAQFEAPACHAYDEPPQFSAWRSGAQDAAYDARDAGDDLRDFRGTCEFIHRMAC